MMQSAAISNSIPGNQPGATAAANLPPSLPAGSRSSTPFTNVFQAALKDSRGGVPLNGKAKDSSREPSRGAGPTGNLLPPIPVAAPNTIPTPLSVNASALPLAPIVVDQLGPQATAVPPQSDDPVDVAAGDLTGVSAGRGAAAPANASQVQNILLSESALVNGANEKTPPQLAAATPTFSVPEKVPDSQEAGKPAVQGQNSDTALQEMGLPSGSDAALPTDKFPNVAPNSPILVPDNAARPVQPAGPRSDAPALAAASAATPAANAGAASSAAATASGGGLPLPLNALAHSAAKSAADAASSIKIRPPAQSSGGNGSQPAPTPAAVPPRAASQDNSNSTSSNDTNSKTDRGSNSRTQDKSDKSGDGKGFAQMLEPAVAPGAGNSSAGESAAMAGAASAQPAHFATGPATSQTGSGDARSAEALPPSAPNDTGVSSARFVNQPGQSEIRIELQADSLGGVELRAHIAGDQIGASIAVEHHDAQMALTTDLPALHSALLEKNIRLESLTVHQGNFSSLAGDSGQPHNQQKFLQPQAKNAYWESPQAAPLARNSGESPTEWTRGVHPGAGLSVVA